MLDEPDVVVSGEIPASVREFCAIPSAYEPDDRHNALFVRAMRDITAWHIERSPWYAGFARRNGVDPLALQSMADVLALPAVHANFFKGHEIRSIPATRVVAHLTSSGTTGQKSQMFFDEFTLTNARAMVDRCLAERGFPSERPANYLVNGYEPYEGFKVGTSNTSRFLTRYAPAAEEFWTLRHIGGGRHEFDPFGTIRTLQSWAASDTPVRIIGFPAFLFFTLERMQQTGIARLALPRGSWVVFGGGWKGHADRAVSRQEMIDRIGQQLDIGPDNIIETFGSVEHSVPYVGCRHQRLHQPTWSRVVVRDLKTLQPVPDGTPGFLSFVSPYITSVPAHSVIMGDLAVRHPAGTCDCGAHATPWFEVLGRAGVSANRSCAAAAAELLRGGT
jgi:phenylacetate-coenzyme A ligase PaaK-like adenylate-forming protein